MRIVSDEEIIDERLDNMCGKFIRMGYFRQLVEKYKNEAVATERIELLRPKGHVDTKKERVPLVLTFGPHSGKISNILRKHWPMVKQGCPKVEAFKLPTLMSYKRDWNIRDMLVRSDVGSMKKESIQTTLIPPKMGNFPSLHCA